MVRKDCSNSHTRTDFPYACPPTAKICSSSHMRADLILTDFVQNYGRTDFPYTFPPPLNYRQKQPYRQKQVGRFCSELWTNRFPLCVPSLPTKTAIPTKTGLQIRFRIMDEQISPVRALPHQPYRPAKFCSELSTNRFPLCVPSPFKLPCSRIPLKLQKQPYRPGRF